MCSFSAVPFVIGSGRNLGGLPPACITLLWHRTNCTRTRDASENLRTPGKRAPREQAVRLLDRSRPELLDAQRIAQLRVRDRPEIRRAESIDVERDVRFILRPLRAAIFEGPAS